MKDIDKNISALIRAKVDNNTKGIQFIENSLSIDIDLTHATSIKEANVNIENDTSIQSVFYVKLTKGVYYYRHLFNKVTSDNAQCLFMVATRTASPFFSYFGQSPILDTSVPCIIAHSFFVDEDGLELYVKIKPSTANFKISSYIAIFKLQED